MSNTEPKHPRRYLAAPHVRERYDGRSAMWLWRKLKHDTKFPRPVVISGRRFFDESELDAYDEASRMEATNATAT
jgi:predicted DNA-binding transcriptional regulator AlpA